MPTLQSIEEKIAKLREQAEQIKAQQNKKPILAILAKMQSQGISIADLQAVQKETGSAPQTTSEATRREVPIKYRGPNGETWTGRGLAPKWLSSLIAAGRRKEEFSV